MVKLFYYYLYLPVTLLAALCTDTSSSQFVCIGESVEVFQNITSTSFREEITLYKAAVDRNETIAVWIMQNFSIKYKVRDKYKHKVSLDNGTILLQDFQTSDEATYVMLYNDSSTKNDVQLCAFDPPKLSCKPNIEHHENFLVASLNNPDNCGKPIASVHWMEYPDITYISKSRIKLPPGKEAGTYRACIEVETIKCVNKSLEWDKCENFTIGYPREYNSPTIADIPQLKSTNYAIVVMVSLVLFFVIAILIKLFWKRPNKHTSVETEQRTSEQSPLQEPPLQEPPLQEPPLQEPPLQDVSDEESGPEDAERAILAQDGDIELQLMRHVHH